MRRPLVWLLLPIALFGMWLGFDLTNTHFVVQYEPDTSLDQWCDVSGTFNCTAVARSKFAHVSMGEGRPHLPVSLPAIGFFAALGLLGLLAGFTKDAQRARAVLALVGLILLPALAFSAYLFGVQALALKVFCIKCLLLDGAVVAAVVVAVLAHGEGPGALLRSLRPFAATAAAAAIGVGLLFNGVAWSRYTERVRVQEAKNVAIADALKPDGGDHSGHGHAPGEGHDAAGKAPTSVEDLSPEQQEELRKQLAEILEQARTAIAQFYKDYDTFPRKELTPRAFDGRKGTTEAVVRIFEFADFECPHCQMAAPQIKDLVERYGDKIEVVFKNYPLGKKCNEALTRDVHPNACEAAVAVQCGGQAGRYWEMHDLVFATAAAGETLSTRQLKKLAEQVGLDANEFANCLTSDDTWGEVRAQVADGRAAGISGTPSFFVNGVAMPSPHPAFVEAAVRRELIALGVTDLPADQDGVFGN